MNFYPYILFALAIVFFLLANTLYVKYKGNRFHYNYVIAFILAGIFYIINAHVALSENQEQAMFWVHMLSISHFFFPLILGSLLHLSDKPVSILNKKIRYLLYVPFIILFFLDLINPGLTMAMPEMTKYGWAFSNKSESPVLLVYGIFYGLNIIGVLLLLWRVYKTTNNEIKKRFCLFYFLALISPFVLFVFLTYAFENSTDYYIPFLTFLGFTVIGFVIFFLKKYSIFDVTMSLALPDIVSNISTVLVLINANNIIKEVNPHTLSLLGYNKKELQNTPIYHLIDKNYWEKHTQNKKNTTSFQGYLQSKTGSKIISLITITRIVKKKLILGYVVLANDLRNITRLTDEKKITMLRLKTLQSQMNPHFMFNAINSIHYLISKNDEIRTNEYLTKLSLFIRKSIANSNENYIALEEEIDNLRNYIEIEKFRSNNAFSYNIEVETSDGIVLREIPPMLVQPLVENAIWHGLLTQKKDTLKKLDISIKVAAHTTIIVIKYNGAARGNNKQIDPSQLDMPTINSVENVHERIKLINRYSEKYTIELKNIDKKDVNESIIQLTLTETNTKL